MITRAGWPQPRAAGPTRTSRDRPTSIRAWPTTRPTTLTIAERAAHRRCPAPTAISRRWASSSQNLNASTAPPPRCRPQRTNHRHPRRGNAKPRNGFPDVLDGPAGRHRRRRRQVRTDRADVAGDGELRGRCRNGRRAGQHAVLRRGQRGEQVQGRAVPVDHHRAVRGDRAAHRPGAGPAAARPPRRAGDLVRAAHRAGGGADHELRRRHRQLPVNGALSMRAGHDGVLEVVQRAAQRGDAEGDAADHRPGAG